MSAEIVAKLKTSMSPEMYEKYCSKLEAAVSPANMTRPDNDGPGSIENLHKTSNPLSTANSSGFLGEFTKTRPPKKHDEFQQPKNDIHISIDEDISVAKKQPDQTQPSSHDQDVSAMKNNITDLQLQIEELRYDNQQMSFHIAQREEEFSAQLQRSAALIIQTLRDEFSQQFSDMRDVYEAKTDAPSRASTSTSIWKFSADDSNAMGPKDSITCG